MESVKNCAVSQGQPLTHDPTNRDSHTRKSQRRLQPRLGSYGIGCDSLDVDIRKMTLDTESEMRANEQEEAGRE